MALAIGYTSLMPHAVCWRQDPRLIWTMAVTNAVTFLSYSAICATLLYLLRRTRRVVARDWAYFVVGFALFIVACGSTHLMEVITTWIPVFWIDAWANIITAVLSGYVAIQFFRRATVLGYGINDYASRLASTESEKARVEDNLLAARRLEEWNRMSAAVTHEISNPLESIQNLLYLIQNSPGATPQIAEMAHNSSDEVARVIAIARGTLGFFRPGLAVEPTDLHAAAESVRFLLEPLMRQREIELSIRAAGDCVVDGYPVEARQVLLNLVRNACEASTKPGSRVTITIEGGLGEVYITVEDQGTGIDPALLPNLFQFGVSTKGERGNGMGLWSVKKLIERHGGTIRVESIPGQGTRFFLVWPREFPVAAPGAQTGAAD